MGRGIREIQGEGGWGAKGDGRVEREEEATKKSTYGGLYTAGGERNARVNRQKVEKACSEKG